MTSVSICLHERFEGQVAATPDALALTFGGESLTYRDLNARANQIAHHLRQCGVGPEVRVGLCLDRGFDIVVAILAVLKAGGAYVPMDPVYPEERVRLIVADAGCPVVLTHAAHQGRFHGGGARVIVLDGESRPWDSAPASNLACEMAPSSLAYVIYTSGSTGKPKGALITHWNVYRLFTAMQPDFGFDSRDVWTMFHSYAFDFSVWEMWGALFHGGRLVVVPHLVSREPEQFHQLLIDEKVTVLNQTPSAFKQLQLFDETVPLEMSRQLSLRYVLVGGEYMALPGLAPWYRRHGEDAPRLVHVYGITETTVFVTYRFLSVADTAPGTPSLIGTAITDLTVYVLDEDRQPVGVGDVGELYVGGPGVCLGYLNRPELTAERFIPNPFPEADGAPTLYKTGDLVRLLDGDLEFIGRNDMQVQLRGFRVELGEIEAALAAHGQVRAAAVRMREDTPGDQRLAAYYLAAAPVPPAELREHLGKTVPPYMVPSAFVHLEAFPLNNNGKIDAGALPAPAAYACGASDYVAPESEVEKSLVSLWEDLLGVQAIGTRDDFFQLGGHSLLVTQLIVRIRKRYGVNLPLRAVMESPTVGALARIISESAGRGLAEPESLSIPRADRNLPVPLSFAQERLWIIDRLEPDNTAYNIPILFTIRGEVVAERLRRAVQALAGRHEVLRTVFVEQQGQPAQQVLPSANVPFSICRVDRNEPESAAGAWVRQQLSAASRARIDLAAGPLLKFLYFDGGPGRTYLGLVIHHAVFDGWSISVLLNDLAASYEAQEHGDAAPRPPLDCQYADYSVWQRQQSETDAFREQVAYWKKQLAGPLPVLELHTDHPRPARQTWAGAVAACSLGADTTQALEQLAARHKKTLFVVLLAAWKALLHRYTGQDDIIVGSAIAGRNHQDLENLIGFFVNTVVLRTRPTGDLAFTGYLEAVGEVVLGAQENQGVPFEQLVAEVRHERDPSRPPIFQVAFVLHNTPVYEAAFSGLRISGEEISNGGAKFELSLSVQPQGGGLQLNLEYNTALFDGSTAAGMLDNYRTLLDSILTAPGARLSELDILTARQKDRLLRLRGADAPLDRTRSLAGIFEAHAAGNPNVLAVADGTVDLTYAELDGRANQVARLLLDRGVQREEPVPFYLSRSVHTVVAMLGILKAGAAYVPLDLQDPPGRRHRVLGVLKPRLILSERTGLGILAADGLDVIPLDDPDSLAPYEASAPGIPVGGDSLAYIIFTSGSTGEPKGVCCNHLGVMNLFQDLHARQPVGPGDACSVWAAFSFDASVYEVWTALLAGAAVHVVPEHVRLEPQSCLDWMRENRIAAAYLPGYMMPALLVQQRVNPVPLRRLMVGVEPLAESLLCNIVEATPGLLLVNAYGPTEATVYVTLYPVVPRTPRPTGNAPIGAAIQNTHLYILDSEMNLVPAGVPGELYAGGAGLARGYYGDPELTASQFVPDPFGAAPGGRLYRTGDQVFLREDGNLHYVRRMGRYFKLRGLRIDPGEIESVLRTLPGVSEAVAVVRDDVEGGERIVAYVTGDGAGRLDEARLRGYLDEELPVSMVPAQFVLLDSLPRTVQGKLDRAALPAPPAPGGKGDLVGPRNETESRLVGLWCECLKLPDVSVQSNFFDLGGHSLLAIQLVSRLNEEFQRSISLLDFFDRPTIEGLAARLDMMHAGGQGATRNMSGRLLEIKSGTGIPFFSVKGAGDVGGSYETFASALAADQPFFGFPDLDFPDIASGDVAPSVEALASRCIRAIKAIRPRGPYYVGGYSFGGVVAFEIARQLLEAGEEVPLIAMLDSGVPGHFEARGVTAFARMRSRLVSLRVRAVMLAYTWKMLIGYARDGIRVAIRKCVNPPALNAVIPSWGEYLRWIHLDTSVQYYLIQAGLVKPSIRERRLEMVEEHLVRHSTRSMADSQVAMDQYTLVPIPAAITLFRAEHNPWKTEKRDPTLGWGLYAGKGVRIVVVPGNHMVIIRRPYATDLGKALQRAIDELQEKPG